MAHLFVSFEMDHFGINPWIRYHMVVTNAKIVHFKGDK